MAYRYFIGLFLSLNSLVSVSSTFENVLLLNLPYISIVSYLVRTIVWASLIVNLMID